MRLTCRGRAVLILLSAAMLVTALVAVVSPIAQAAGPAAERTVVVRSGETLWGIARRADPRTDPRDAVLELQQVNHLVDASIQPGQVLRLPSSFPAP